MVRQEVVLLGGVLQAQQLSWNQRNLLELLLPLEPKNGFVNTTGKNLTFVSTSDWSNGVKLRLPGKDKWHQRQIDSYEVILCVLKGFLTHGSYRSFSTRQSMLRQSSSLSSGGLRAVGS